MTQRAGSRPKKRAELGDDPRIIPAKKRPKRISLASMSPRKSIPGLSDKKASPTLVFVLWLGVVNQLAADDNPRKQEALSCKKET
ncbi:hypothetical protein GX50_03064 [[Emmonsia] crescens]|uniref:Uncharacterized protein n=1 Tax=[Emmonsia] crescens TaxID=73230 RepID=A0A2B7ZL70_9EURO|nr:hypothetical protein GX50_03064 [Emmonsia crescens]